MTERRRHLLRLAGVAALMFGFGFALVPMYRVVCQLVNLNGKDNGLVTATTIHETPDLSREVTVQFTTQVNGGRDWGFKPETSEIKVHPGELYTVNFTARNPDDQALVAQAVPSVTPWNAARYLKKTECFCFRQQPFKAGEQKSMPVRFMLERELPADVDTVTLSYTFFDVTAQARAARSQPQS
jgi:cytochrome c oxidase assembly protein subunit 11